MCWFDGHGTSLNFPVARLYTITSTESVADLATGVWVLTVTTVGVVAVEVGVEDTGWVSTLTFYPLLVVMDFSFCHWPWFLGFS